MFWERVLTQHIQEVLPEDLSLLCFHLISHRNQIHLLYYLNESNWTLPIFAFIFAILIVSGVYVLSFRNGRTPPVVFLLTGIAISLFATWTTGKGTFVNAMFNYSHLNNIANGSGIHLNRIVSLDPAASATLYAIGAFKDVLGKGPYTTYPKSNLPNMTCYPVIEKCCILLVAS